MEWLVLKGLVEYCWINQMVLSPLFPKKEHYESQTLSIFFIFSPNWWGLEDHITVLQISKMFEGRILFIHVGWLLRLPPLMPLLISWCWCRRAKNRWWDFTCGNVGRVRVVAISILQKKRLCLIIFAWCSIVLWGSIFCLLCFGALFANTSRIGAQLFDSIACWTLHKLKRRFRFLIGQRHGGEKKIGFNDAKKQQMIWVDVSQWHAIICCHVLSYLQGGPLPGTNRFKTPMNRVITPVTYLYDISKATCRCHNSISI